MSNKVARRLGKCLFVSGRRFESRQSILQLRSVLRESCWLQTVVSVCEHTRNPH
ncbi:Transposase [Caenorhabditis elegans]|uniref:Transposase n=1 Tax=Caenorhabditis elegans TaxID=6239 RepID=G8JY82_CAEEL|nr:Transposase [Caenorhabditis elegans]CCD68778.1 Transposase [Caenorhabditis elegans]|eukprot:NP_741160.1 Uncharacterized protein CELE_F25B5.3 [Caenorhabditis elegans]